MEFKLRCCGSKSLARSFTVEPFVMLLLPLFFQICWCGDRARPNQQERWSLVGVIKGRGDEEEEERGLIQEDMEIGELRKRVVVVVRPNSVGAVVTIRIETTLLVVVCGACARRSTKRRGEEGKLYDCLVWLHDTLEVVVVFRLLSVNLRWWGFPVVRCWVGSANEGLDLGF
ncbi:hypothetical protein HAX54_017654 [Datura stramonium]|uniref:Uncharacterized protein n=1 Tax=Datura stramonium TaxID=4076 RepID=A0ABS8UL32_DATST|nr:hypothetical protein [Datura stramonium]